MGDLALAIRGLRRSPALLVAAVLTLGLGMGANTAVFSVLETVLLRPLPFPQPERLTIIRETTQKFDSSSDSYQDFLDWRRDAKSFAGMTAYRPDDGILALPGALPQHLKLLMASANLFQVVGVPLLAGPGFDAAEDRPNGRPEAVLSYGFWRSQLGGRDLIGHTIPLNGQDVLVVGIAPPSFWWQSNADVIMLLGQYEPELMADRGNHMGLTVVARLQPDATLAASQREMSAEAAGLAARYPKDDAGQGARVRLMREYLVSYAGATLWLLLAAVGLVLLIACANVANLLLARAQARQRELSLRAALGAAPARLARLLLAEAAVLAVAGSALGLGLAVLLLRVAPTLIPMDLPRLSQLGLHWRVLAFTAVATLLCTLVAGLAPALRFSRPILAAALAGGARAGSTHRRLHAWLVGGEIALAFLLLASAGLVGRSLLRIWSLPPGFDPHPVFTATVAVSPRILQDGPAIKVAHETLVQRVSELPGVAASAETTLLPLNGDDSEMGFWRAGQPQPQASEMRSALTYFVTPGYFKAMSIPLVAGRDLTEQDRAGAPTVAVIDTVFAKTIFPGVNPLGRHLKNQYFPDFEVVGVVGHVRHWGLAEDDTAPIRQEWYIPLAQVPDRFFTLAGAGLSLLVRVGPGLSDPERLLPQVRQAVAGAAGDQPIFDVKRFDDMVADSLGTQRFVGLLLAGFAGLAALLAAVGIYGVLAYAVTQRTQEIGTRLALGAGVGRVLRMVLRQGLGLVLLGCGAGLTATFFASRLLRAYLYGVGADDPLTLVGVLALIAAAATLASYLPARRAAALPPAVALRAE